MKTKYTKEQLKNAIENNVSFASCLRDLNLNIYGGNYKSIRIQAEKFGFSLDHFTGQSQPGNKNIFKSIPLKDILIENSTYGSTKLKNRLYKENIKDKICEICKISSWQNKDLTLELHHINGNDKDNRLENLQILCPNCHSQTRNFRVPNVYSKITRTKTFCKECEVELLYKTKNNLCQKCFSIKQRKVKRPPKEILEKEILTTSFVQLGKKYGVSDNAVRKWCKSYNITL